MGESRLPLIVRRWPRTTLVGLGLLLCVAIDLVAGRLLASREATAFRRPHPIYHHDLVPGSSGQASWGPIRYPVHTNSLGFRDASPREVPLRSERHRVLLMGDSFTEGIGVAWEDSFAGMLAADLAPLGIEILNAGVIGYSPKLYLRKTRHLLEDVGLEVDEVVVLLDNSDVPNEIVYASYPAGRGDWVGAWREVTRFLRRHSYLVHATASLAHARNAMRWNAAGMPFSDDLDDRALEDPAFFADGRWTEDYKYAARGLELAAENMAELVALCRSHELPLTLVVYPWPKNIAHRDRDHVMVRFWRDFARERGVGFVDLYGEFIDRSEVAGHRHFFIEGDVHWTRAGNAVVADRLREILAPDS